jgi:hypothetical protein
VGENDWDCNGDIDRVDRYRERWSCHQTTNNTWQCSGELGRLYPAMMPILLSE